MIESNNNSITEKICIMMINVGNIDFFSNTKSSGQKEEKDYTKTRMKSKDDIALTLSTKNNLPIEINLIKKSIERDILLTLAKSDKARDALTKHKRKINSRIKI